MQMQLPLFPRDTRLVNATLGIREDAGMVYYLHNGSPIFCHDKSDINHYRFICGNLVTTRLCRASELADVLGVNRRSIERYAKKYREKGTDGYFNKQDRRGQCFKMTPEVLSKVQDLLDQGLSKEAIARQLHISSSSIRNHIKKGTLKKRNNDLPNSNIFSKHASRTFLTGFRSIRYFWNWCKPYKYANTCRFG